MGKGCVLGQAAAAAASQVSPSLAPRLVQGHTPTCAPGQAAGAKAKLTDRLTDYWPISNVEEWQGTEARNCWRTTAEHEGGGRSQGRGVCATAASQ